MKLIKPTKIEEFQETKADRIIESVFIIGLSSLLIFLVILILSTTSHAEESPSTNFPYALSTYRGTIPDSVIDIVISDFRSASGYTGDNFIIFATDTNWTSIFFKVIIDPCFNMPNNLDEYDYMADSYNIFSYSGSNQYNFWYRPDNGAHGQYGSATANTGYAFGGSDSSIGFYYTWYPHFPIYMGVDYVYNRFAINTPSETVPNIGIYKTSLPAVIPSINTGHATEPDFDPDNNVTGTGHAQQPSTPTFPVFVQPTIDTSTLETLVESLIDTVSEFADYVGECFSVFFSWTVSVIQNGLQSVINTIREGFDTFYQNMLSLFEPFFSAFNNFLSIVENLYNLGVDENDQFSLSQFLTKLIVPDPQDLVDIIEENDEYNLIGIFEYLNTAISAFKNTISNNTRKYITIPQCTFMGVSLGPYQVDFSWYDDYKVYGDGVISAILIFGYLFFLYTRISGILNHEGNSANKAEGGHL